MIRVTWNQATTVGIASYDLQSSTDNVTFTALASVPHAIPGVNWDATYSVFYYDHATGTALTWYRVAAVDGQGNVSPWSTSFRATGTPIPVWDTAGNIVNAAAVEVGLSDVADPFASTDANIKQMCWLLKSLGRELIHARTGPPWSYLRKEYVFTTVAGQSQYCLPQDWHNMIEQTGWNRTNRLPVGGPLSAQEWQYLKARLVGVVFNVLIRPMNRSMNLYPDTNTPGGYVIAMEYCSSWWVSPTGAPNATTTDIPTLSSDRVWFDPLLLIRGLKLSFLKAKGFDTTSAQQDYNRVLAAAEAQDAPSRKMSLNRNTVLWYDPLLGQQNIPITGFGT